MNEKHQDYWISDDHIHLDLQATKSFVYNPCQFTCSRPLAEKESAKYGAYTFELNGHPVRFRVAKVTPTKTGQFVTLWKRVGNGPIQPFDISDPVDFFVISTRKNDHFGQFVFPKSVLCEKDIISMNGQCGKRAIRVYPPWDKTLNRQARKTQQWQMEYFLEVPQNRPLDIIRSQMLYRYDQ